MYRITAWALLFLATPCLAQQTESVTVNASALVGAWEVTHPFYIAKHGIFSAFEFGPPTPGFCRIEQAAGDLAFHCFNSGNGTVTLEGRDIHFAGGSMMARIVLDGSLESGNSFTGHQAIKLAGITAEDSQLSSGRKIDLSAAQAGPAAALLRTILTNGLAQVPHDAKVKDSPVLTPELGAVQAVIWLGHQNKGGGPTQPPIKDYFSVYAVEFDHGERLCGLHQRDNSVLDAFQCA